MKEQATSEMGSPAVADLQAPLLVDRDGQDHMQLLQQHPDCPGCRAAHLRDKNAGVPLKLLVCLGLLVLCNCLPISVLYPFVYFMVKDFHVAKSDEDIGYYAGWLGSAFMAGRAVTGLIWGAIGDRYGRRPVMFLGVTSVLIFNTLFGLSTNFAMALTTRFILGAFNGMLGVLKAYASEICNEEHQAIGISVLGTAWGFGLVIGPALGGFLAQPALKYPDMFPKGTLFDRFPYLLQALCVSAFALIGFAVIWTLPETLHKHKPVSIDNDVEKPNDNTKSASKEKPQENSIYRNWPLMASTAVYCLWSLHDIAYTEIFSLWSVSSKSYGGLNFTSSDVGGVLAASGCAMLVSQLLVFPLFAKAVGAIAACRYPALLTIPLLIAYPFFNKIPGIWMYVTVYAASILKYIFTMSTTTGSFLLINNTVTQRQRGAANGFSLSVVSVFKAIGPATGGIVFAWAQTRRDTWFLPGDHLVFFFLNVFALLTVLVTMEPFLPKSANKLLDDS